jgi:hypothetical protein
MSMHGWSLTVAISVEFSIAGHRCCELARCRPQLRASLLTSGDGLLIVSDRPTQWAQFYAAPSTGTFRAPARFVDPQAGEAQ